MRAAIQDFLDAMTYGRGFTPKTCEAYGHDLAMMCHFVQQRGRKTWAEVTLEDLVAHLHMLQRRAHAATSLKRYAAAFKTFFAWLLEEGRIAVSPTDALVSGKVPQRLPRTLDEATLNGLIEAVSGEAPLALRDRAILEVLYGCGLRCGEVLALRLHDVDFTDKRLLVHGKGRKERVVPFGPPAEKALKRYLAYRNDFAATYRKGARAADLLQPEAPLFLSPTGRRLSGATLAQMVHARIHAFLPPGVNATPHTLRHAFATHLLNHGAPLLDIRDLLGHASISTTQIYTHVSDTHLRDTFNRCFPRS